MDELNEELYLNMLNRLKQLSREMYLEAKKLSQNANGDENDKLIVAEISGLNAGRDMVHREIGSLVMWHDLEWNEQS